MMGDAGIYWTAVRRPMRPEAHVMGDKDPVDEPVNQHVSYV